MGVVGLMFAIIIVGFLLAGVHARASIKLRSLQRMWIDEFFKAAEKLTEDDQTPRPVKRVLRTMAAEIYSPRFCRRLVMHLLTRQSPSNADIEEIRADFMSIPAHRRPEFMLALVSFCFALTYNNYIIGYVLRRLFWVSKPTTQQVRSSSIDGDGRLTYLGGEVISKFSSKNGAVAA